MTPRPAGACVPCPRRFCAALSPARWLHPNGPAEQPERERATQPSCRLLAPTAVPPPSRVARRPQRAAGASAPRPPPCKQGPAKRPDPRGTCSSPSAAGSSASTTPKTGAAATRLITGASRDGAAAHGGAGVLSDNGGGAASNDVTLLTAVSSGPRGVSTIITTRAGASQLSAAGAASPATSAPESSDSVAPAAASQRPLGDHPGFCGHAIDRCPASRQNSHAWQRLFPQMAPHPSAA